MGPQVPLSLAIRPSASLTAFLFVAHGLALACLGPLALALWAKVTVAFVLLFSCIRSVWRSQRPDWRFLHLSEAGRMRGETARGDLVDTLVHPHTLVLPGLIVLLLQEEEGGRLRSLVLPKDALATTEHRRLRRWLLWSGEARSKPEKTEDGALS